MSNGGVPRELHSDLIYAAAAANAWLRGLSIPRVALDYRYEPITALNLIRRCCDEYGAVNVEPYVPRSVLDCARSKDLERDRPAWSRCSYCRPPASELSYGLPAGGKAGAHGLPSDIRPVIRSAQPSCEAGAQTARRTLDRHIR